MKGHIMLRNLAAILMLLATVSMIPNEKNAVIAALKTKNIKTLEEALKAGIPVVVKLGSDSCYPCRMMNPIMKELAVEQAGKAIFLNLDIYKNRELAGRYSVRVIPTIIFFDKLGKFRDKNEGFMNKEQILKMIDKLRLPAGRQG